MFEGLYLPKEAFLEKYYFYAGNGLLKFVAHIYNHPV